MGAPIALLVSARDLTPGDLDALAGDVDGEVRQYRDCLAVSRGESWVNLYLGEAGPDARYEAVLGAPARSAVVMEVSRLSRPPGEWIAAELVLAACACRAHAQTLVDLPSVFVINLRVDRPTSVRIGPLRSRGTKGPSVRGSRRTG